MVLSILSTSTVTGRLKVDPYLIENWLVGLYILENSSLSKDPRNQRRRNVPTSLVPAMLALSVAGFDGAIPQQTVETIGSSRQGRPIELTIRADPIATAHQRPAILIVSGFDGEHHVGPALTRALAGHLASHHSELLEEVTFYLLPLGNPDGSAERRRGNARPIDLDRDGMLDEDPPRDLDGDGMITMMRVHPPLDAPATHLQDPGPAPDDRTRSSKGREATHSLYIEGIDADGDGLIGEDGPDGVDPLRNFMHRWPEYELASGSFPPVRTNPAIASFVLRDRTSSRPSCTVRMTT